MEPRGATPGKPGAALSLSLEPSVTLLSGVEVRDRGAADGSYQRAAQDPGQDLHERGQDGRAAEGLREIHEQRLARVQGEPGVQRQRRSRVTVLVDTGYRGDQIVVNVFCRKELWRVASSTMSSAVVGRLDLRSIC